MKSLIELFPRASAATVAANPQLAAPNTGSGKQKIDPSREWRKAAYPGMNKTESEFAIRLEAQKRAGEILRYEYEGITLRWADMRYTPDFIAFTTIDPKYIRLYEVKGGHIWDRDIVRFKGARAYWPEFAFEMHQKTKQGWKRKY